MNHECGESRCELVYDRSLLPSADAVVFHPIDMPPEYTLPEGPRNPDQPWVFFSLEAPGGKESVYTSNWNT